MINKALLSHRYGHKVLPERILKEDFILIRDELKSLEFDLSFRRKNSALECNIDNLLEYCYKLDVNERLESYVLQDKDIILPGYKLDLEVLKF